MTKKFKEKILDAVTMRRTVTHGKYAYDVCFHPIKKCNYIVRCKRDLLDALYIDADGYHHDYWEYVEPMD